MRPNKIYRRFGKRLLDMVWAALGLAVLSPLFVVCAVVIKLTSPGPIFYRQGRVGRHWHTFQILKFRTMVNDAHRQGPLFTVGGDSRTTQVGAVLRRLKIDELPQLWNVLKGEMSLVGPRPEIPGYVRSYSTHQQYILTVRPGISDIASIAYRDEEELLRRTPNPEQFYREVLLPNKLALNLEYIEKMTLSHDLFLILQTLKSVFLSSLVKKKTN